MTFSDTCHNVLERDRIMSNTFSFSADLSIAQVSEAYSAADQKGKARMRADFEKFRDSVIREVSEGRTEPTALGHVLAMGEALRSQKPVAEPTDYAQLFAQQVADMRATLAAIESGEATLTFPEGVTPEAITGWRDRDVTGVAHSVAVAGRKAMRGSVGDYVDSVLGESPMTVAQLRAAWSPSSDYPKQAPTAGAISAWLTRDNERSVEARAEVGIEATEVGGVLAAERV